MASKIFRFLLGISLAVGFSSGAFAQATRTWVSGVGDDANPCSRTAPCKTFAGAISKTAAAGEINVLDPGGFGAVTITKSISIIADHVEAGVLVSMTNGIIISAGVSDRVVLEGLDIEGLGTGLNGVRFIAGKELYIIRCEIRHFTQNGVSVETTSGARAFIHNSFILFNAGGVNLASGANLCNITDTHILSNTSFSIQANNGASFGVANSSLNGSPMAIKLLGTGQAFSFGPSNVVGGAGAFTGAPLPFK